MNKCPRCLIGFETWKEYSTHQQTQTCYKKILPLKTSNKTTSQIAEELEIKLGKDKFFDGTLKPVVKPMIKDKPILKTEFNLTNFMNNMKDGMI